MNHRHCLLIFEDLAHEKRGHYPHLLAEIARGLAAEGHEVHLLTTRGWALESEGHTLKDVATISCMPRACKLVVFLTEATEKAFRKLRKFNRHAPRILSRLTLATLFIRQVALVLAVNRAASKLGGKSQPPVIVLSVKLQFHWAALLAPRTARWAVHEYFGPPGSDNPGTLRRRLAVQLLQRQERRRRAFGGHVRLAANSALVLDKWRDRYPWIEGNTVPTPAKPAMQKTNKSLAREKLGIEAGGRVALHFGCAHPGKDISTILRAYASHEGLGTLVIAGLGTAEQVSSWRLRNGELVDSFLIVIDGYVSEIDKHLLYSAADLAILSFEADISNDSGTLSDAVAYRLPVCCSDRGAAGSIVEAYRLGSLFPPGDPTALALAIKGIPEFVLQSQDLERYFQDRSPSAVGTRLLVLAAKNQNNV